MPYARYSKRKWQKNRQKKPQKTLPAANSSCVSCRSWPNCGRTLRPASRRQLPGCRHVERGARPGRVRGGRRPWQPRSGRFYPRSPGQQNPRYNAGNMGAEFMDNYAWSGLGLIGSDDISFGSAAARSRGDLSADQLRVGGRVSRDRRVPRMEVRRRSLGPGGGREPHLPPRTAAPRASGPGFGPCWPCTPGCIDSPRVEVPPAMTSGDPLLQPFRLRHLTLKNRIMSTGHTMLYAVDGAPREREQLYHEEKAKGGIAMTMFGGSSAVAQDSATSSGVHILSEDSVIPHFRRFADRIHRHDCALMCQITHLGRRARTRAFDWLPTVSASRTREVDGGFPKVMDRADIDRIVTSYGEAARRCREGGLDGCEVVGQAHLPEQFWSPAWNSRTDEFGGSLENRLRFGFMVLEEIRRKGRRRLYRRHTHRDRSESRGRPVERRLPRDRADSRAVGSRRFSQPQLRPRRHRARLRRPHAGDVSAARDLPGPGRGRSRGICRCRRFTPAASSTRRPRAAPFARASSTWSA